MSDPHPPAGSGIGTLDRAVEVLGAVEAGAHRFTAIVRATGLPRATVHRLVRALEHHGFLAHLPELGYRLGPRLLRLANEAMRELPLPVVAHPVLERLVRATGESAQLFTRLGDARVCIDAVESMHELRTIVPVGASLPLSAGSAAKVLLVSAPDRDRHVRRASDPERFARDVELARARGWAASSGERQAGVASVSAPILGPYDLVLAAVSLSGPATRFGKTAARRYASAVVGAARQIEEALGR